jgi:N-acyl-phosphatidylethanolamine-hydrolysing phospholipase D
MLRVRRNEDQVNVKPILVSRRLTDPPQTDRAFCMNGRPINARNGQMTQRSFLHRFMAALASSRTAFAIKGCRPFAGAAGEQTDARHYLPLNGLVMADLARRHQHHGDGRFRNPFSPATHGSLGRVLRWKFFSTNHFKAQYAAEPHRNVSLDDTLFRSDAKLQLTFLRHATLIIKDVDAYIFVDPVFGGLFWFIEDFTPLAFNPQRLPQPRHILITHGHYDHLDLPSLAILHPQSNVLTPLGYNAELAALTHFNRKQLDWYDRHFEDGREFIFLPCNHWTMRRPLVGPNTSLWGSYLIRTKAGATIYISGDTAYFDGFEQIGAAFDIDLAVFNLGAYEPRWFMAPSHLNPPETVAAFQQLGARHLMIMHWGTFRLGDEPVHAPPRDIKTALAAQHLTDCLIEARQGQTFPYG